MVYLRSCQISNEGISVLFYFLLNLTATGTGCCKSSFLLISTISTVDNIYNVHQACNLQICVLTSTFTSKSLKALDSEYWADVEDQHPRFLDVRYLPPV